MFCNLLDELEMDATKSRKSVVLAAPYIKSIIKKVIDLIPASVSLVVVTNWDFDSFKSGASDPIIYELVSNRPNSMLLHHPRLHAKYYRFDDRCIVGSANLTPTALLDTKSSNLELSIHSPYNGTLDSFETKMKSESRMVTSMMLLALQTRLQNSSTFMDEFAWEPVSYPEDLHAVLTNSTTRPISKDVRDGVAADLDWLKIPSNLTASEFKEYLRSLLDGYGIFKIVVDLASKGVVNEDVWVTLNIESPSRARTISRWVRYLFSDKCVVTDQAEEPFHGADVFSFMSRMDTLSTVFPEVRAVCEDPIHDDQLCQ